jgi:DamX protein
MRLFSKLSCSKLSTWFVAPLFLAVPVVISAQPNITPSDIQLNNLSLEQLNMAADAGDPDAQYALGYMYYYGKHVPQNNQIALNWMRRAAVQGQEQAIKALALLGAPSRAAAPTPVVQPVMQQEPEPTPTYVAPEPKVEYRAMQPTKVVSKPSVRPEPSETTALRRPQSGSPQGQREETPKARTTKTGTKSMREQQPSSVSATHPYTIQLTNGSNKEQIMQFIKKHNLQNKATYHQDTHNGKVSYSVVYGSYKTREEAQKALSNLPASVRAQKPWIKTMKTGQLSNKVI